MAPEQIDTSADADKRADLYAVGVIFYQLLTGRLPFEAESPTQVVLMHITEQPADPRSVAPDRMIPSLLADVCLMALAKDPAHRFSNADEYAEAITDALSHIESAVPRPLPSGTVKCPTCGASNQTGQKFCGECGNAIKEGAAKISIRQEGEGNGVPPSFVPTGGSEPPASKVPVEPGTGKRSILVDRKLAQFPLEFVVRDDDVMLLVYRLYDPKASLVFARIVGDVGMGKSRVLG